ncbi:MAG: class II fructose-bisphosphate aldolase [Spirochaetes bacterium]|nr:class II fructose-bisphosphate aldolase [Spirochaetota bacterium]
MPKVAFARLMEDAERRGYAVGYFESWNMESLLAIADAAEAARSPVILGFSGIALPSKHRVMPEHLPDYAALGSAVCDRVSVPACLLFNESPSFDWVVEAVQRGFGMVMFADEEMGYDSLVETTRKVCRVAHAASVAVEGEPHSLPGVAGDLLSAPADRHMTDPGRAQQFVQATGIDAIAVNVGQAHLHGRGEVRLDLDRVAGLKRAVTVPLVLHGATSVRRDDLREAIRRGVRKINVGSALKRACIESMRATLAGIGPDYNPYEVVGSGLAHDVMVGCRRAVQEVTRGYLELFGSAGKADGFRSL